MAKFTPASFNQDAFNCPSCGVYARQIWHMLARVNGSSSNNANLTVPSQNKSFEATPTNVSAYIINGLNISRCGHCGENCLWLKDKLLVPYNSNVHPAHDDMPESVKVIYTEAAEISNASPRGAAALLRVALELLTHELGCNPESSINNKIAEIVSKGVSPNVVKALDILRVTGNNAAHTSSTLLLDDDAETASALFQIINFIVEQTIAHTKRLDEMHDLFPEGIKRQIEQRNMKALPSG